MGELEGPKMPGWPRGQALCSVAGGMGTGKRARPGKKLPLQR